MSNNRYRTILGVFAVGLLLIGEVTAQATRFPSYGQYKVAVTSTRSCTPDLSSHKKARLYRTNLRNAAHHGTNFAGHFVLTYWGCGTNCAVGAIVDTKNGKVYFPTQLDGFEWGMAMYKHYRDFLVFHSNSRLLILYGSMGKGPGTHYLVWNDRVLKEIAYDSRTDEQQ